MAHNDPNVNSGEHYGGGEAKDPRDSVASRLGADLKKEFDDVEHRRRPYERRWLEDLRQYLATYDEQTLQAIREGDKGRSEMFVPLTRKKVRTADARLRDLLFPSGRRADNWSIAPTDEPQLTPEDETRIRMHLARQMIASQQQVSMREIPQDAITEDMLQRLPREEVDRARKELAEQRCEAMRTRMSDQLGEMRWPVISERVLHSGHVYGIGIVKGPIPDRRTSAQWSYDEQAGWVRSQVERNAPHGEYVPLWSWYPDMAGSAIEECRFAWQEHLYPRHQVLTLAKFEQFDAEAIMRYVRTNPDGDATEKMHEQEIRALSQQETQAPDLKGMYRLLERWGWMSIEKLVECGCEPPTDERTGEVQMEGEVFVSVWMLGDQAIAVMYEPSYHDRLPFHLYYCERLEGNVLDAQGWPRILRNDQSMLNSATRAMLDNAAASAGPQVVIDEAACDGGQTAKIAPWLEWYVNSARAPNATDPVAFKQVPNNTAQLASIVQIGERWSHEHSLPAYMEGQNSPQAGGATDTARGLSMLMSAANIELKDLARNYDHGVTEPFCQQLYDWNMEWADEDHIKGDFKTYARGSTSLMAKEVRAQQAMQFRQLMQGYEDWIRPDRFVPEIAEMYDQPDDIIMSKEEHDRAMKNQPPSTERIEAQVEQMKAKIEAENAKVEAIQGKASAIEDFSQAIENLGGIDVLMAMAEQMGIDISGDGSGTEAQARAGEPAGPSAEQVA